MERWILFSSKSGVKLAIIHCWTRMKLLPCACFAYVSYVLSIHRKLQTLIYFVQKYINTHTPICNFAWTYINIYVSIYLRTRKLPLERLCFVVLNRTRVENNFIAHEDNRMKRKRSKEQTYFRTHTNFYTYTHDACVCNKFDLSKMQQITCTLFVNILPSSFRFIAIKHVCSDTNFFMGFLTKFILKSKTIRSGSAHKEISTNFSFDQHSYLDITPLRLKFRNEVFIFRKIFKHWFYGASIPLHDVNLSLMFENADFEFRSNLSNK